MVLGAGIQKKQIPLVGADEEASKEIETLALEGLNSGAAIETSPSYRQEKHRLLDERLKTVARRRAAFT